ncbi:MAG TPA: globin family protein [Polyangiaceae bacterium]|nr:globin family protein [Polyangiaceae bacterium]
MLTKQEIELVQSDWAKVVPIAEAAATMFYDHLFELDPKLRSLFKSDLSEQKIKLMKMIGYAVNALDNLGEVVPAVQALGKRHAGYGVVSEHYETVGIALLSTLKKGLGASFDEAHETAWGKVYGILADTMRAAAEPARAAAAT